MSSLKRAGVESGVWSSRFPTQRRSYNWSTGYCLAFAKALRENLGRGARLVDVVEPQTKAASASAYPWLFPGIPHHVVVEYQGRYHDAEGCHSSDELLARWTQRAVDNGYRLTEAFRLEPHDARRARDAGLKAPREAVAAARAFIANEYE